MPPTAPACGSSTTCEEPAGILRPVSRPPALAEVNRAIRRLMEQPPGEKRTEEYVRLLALWAKATVTRNSWDKAA